MLGNLQRGLGLYASGAYSYVMANGLSWGVGQDSWFASASPTVADGMMAASSAKTLPDNFTHVMSSTGVPVITSFGSTARQKINLDVYNWSLRSWYGLVTDYVNDLPPVILDPTQYQFTYIQNVAIADLNLAAYALDPEGDLYTISTSSSLPPGLSIASNILTGTPTTLGNYPVTFVATDFLGQATNFPQWTFVIATAPPPPVPPPPQNPKVWIANSLKLNASGSPGDWTNVQQVPFHTWTADGWWDPNGVKSTYPQHHGVPPSLGLNVTTRQFSWNEMVRRAWGSEYSAPDHGIYVWSNGRRFDSTDLGTTGFYRKPQ